VVVATASPARHSFLRELGTVPVAYGDGLAERVREAAPGGINAALDLIGTDEAVDVSLALVATGHASRCAAPRVDLGPVRRSSPFRALQQLRKLRSDSACQEHPRAFYWLGGSGPC
jgi:hypothetical protein